MKPEPSNARPREFLPLKPTDALLVNAKTAAAMLSISARSLWSLTNCGEIPHVRIGRSVRYSIDDLHDWIASHTTGGRHK